ncbi:MAG: PTS sugar transporter subunit IIA [Burkholderiales bacterium]|jgi:PTS system mannose-specific IIA component
MIGLLLVTHEPLGASLLQCATHVLGKLPAGVAQLGVNAAESPETATDRGRALVKTLDTGRGVVILTDMYGATPANVACKLLLPGRVMGISGVNLPMLLRALTYREKPLAEMVERTMAGGIDGVIVMPASAAG